VSGRTREKRGGGKARSAAAKAKPAAKSEVKQATKKAAAKRASAKPAAQKASAKPKKAVAAGGAPKRTSSKKVAPKRTVGSKAGATPQAVRRAPVRRVPSVSILLPCRDAESYLPDTIASIDAQSFRDFEVVAIDDGSTDRTLELLRSWAAENPNVRVHEQPALGLVPALQRAVEVSQGEILVRMDADDVAYSTRIERQVELLNQQPEIGACGTLVRYFPRGSVAGGAQRYEMWINALVKHADITREIFVECPIAHPTMAVRRSVLQAVGGYQDKGWPEDYDLVFRLWTHGVAMAKVPEVLLRWRERIDRTSRTDPRYDEDAFRRIKVHYLKNTLLNGHEGVLVWGAGPVGKAFALELQAQQISVRAFVELDPRKIGQTIHDTPVVAAEGLEKYRDSFAIAAVGMPSAREEIRTALCAAGWVEGKDFVAVA
jgi:GT2 family glycosyltransferase